MKPLLFLIQPRQGPAGARVDVRLSSGADGAAAGLGGFLWEAAIQRRPRMSIEILSQMLDGRVQLGRGDFVVNLNNIRSVKPADLYWPGAPVIIYDASGLNLATAPIEFSGFARSAAMDNDGNTVQISVEVSAQELEKPVLFSEFTGGGGTAGEADTRGKPKPAGFGSVKNIEPVWIDTIRNIGMIDGYGNCTAITALFEGASDFGARVANYANYATLAARIDDGTVPPGRWATAVAEGLVGLGAPPVKPITVDATFGTNRPGALIRRLMEYHAGVAVGDVDVAAFAALDAAVNRAVHHWMGDQRQVKELIESIAASCNATPIVTFQQKFSITRVFGGASIFTYDRQAPSVLTAAGAPKPRVTKWRALESDPPTWRMKMRAARPAAVLTIDQILYDDDLIDRGLYSATEVYRQGNLVWNAAGAQFLYINAVPAAGNAPPNPPATANAWWQETKPAPAASDLFYGDGTPIENLKPAQAAADKTSSNTAAAITSQGALATKNVANLLTDVSNTSPWLSWIDPNTGKIYDARGFQSNRSYGLRAVSVLPTLSDTWVGTNNVTINIGAWTISTDFGTTLNLPTGSITNCAAATKYYLYRDMADPASATGTYGASTSLAVACAPGRIYLGYWTTRATSGGAGNGGGYGGPECVSADAIVWTKRGRIPAREVIVGDWVRIIDAGAAGGWRWERVTHNHLTLQDSVRMAAASGATLTLSLETPITLRDDSQITAAEAYGKAVQVEDAAGLRWSEIIAVSLVGKRVVAHISCGGNTFAAGDSPDEMIYTHNQVKP